VNHLGVWVSLRVNLLMLGCYNCCKVPLLSRYGRLPLKWWKEIICKSKEVMVWRDQDVTTERKKRSQMMWRNRSFFLILAVVTLGILRILSTLQSLIKIQWKKNYFLGVRIFGMSVCFSRQSLCHKNRAEWQFKLVSLLWLGSSVSSVLLFLFCYSVSR